MRRRRTTTYGQKGGQGPNAGKKAAVYTGKLPTGEAFTKRTFNPPLHGNRPVALVYEHDGRWYVNCIVDADNPPSWAKDYIIVEVEPKG